MEDSSKSIPVQIAGTEIRKIEYRGHQVVTFAMIDKVHGRPKDTARKRFNDNLDRFTIGEDYFKISASEIRTHKIFEISPKAHEDFTLVTKRGYLKIAKTLGDDKAWEVFDEMIERYFAVEQKRSLTAEDLLANPSQLLAIAQGYALQVEDMKREIVVLQEDSEALDRISGSDDLLGVRGTAKILDMAERKFTDWIQQIHWAYRQNGTRKLLCYADKHKAGFCKNTVEIFLKPDGTEGVRETLKFYPRGIVQLAKRLNISLTEGDIRAFAAQKEGV